MSKIRKTGIVLSTLLGISLLTSAIFVVITNTCDWSDIKLASIIANNWLLIIFKIHANLISNHDSLSGLNLYDISIILTFILVCLALFEKFRYRYKVWFISAIILLISGLAVYISTKLAGRSAFMVSGLIISFLFLVIQRHVAGVAGILANILLLSGDFTVGANTKIIPYLFGLGYLLLIIWIFMITRILTISKKDNHQCSDT